MDDDSVVIEGSPLYQYMKELELNNLSFDEKLSFKENNKNEVCVHGFWYNTSIKEYVCSKCLELRSKLSHIFPLSQDVLVSLSRQYYTEYGRLILDSKVMLEEDIDYLCLQTPHQFLKSVKIFQQDHDLNSSRYSVLIGVLMCGILSIFFADFTPNFLQILICLLVFGVICFNVRLEIIIEMWKRRHESNLKLLRQFLTTSERLNSVVRKSIRLIQEVEVVSRGYKLVNGKTPISRLEKGESPVSRLFTRLRFVLLRSTIRSTLSCRRATLDLLSYKLDAECDCDRQSYICNIPVSELGSCFEEDTSAAEMFEITDGYSLGVLKSLSEVLVRQRSELLTRLSLTLSGITWDFTSEGFIENFQNILNEPYTTTVDCITSLQSSYDSHKNAEDARKDMKDRQDPPTDVNNLTSALKINLRSLQVHMRAAMHNSMEFEDHLKNNHINDQDLEAKDKFEKVESHLQSGLECYVRCLKELALVEDKNETADRSEHKSVEVPPLGGNKEEDKEWQPVEIEEEIVLEDQIFEGVASNSGSSEGEEDKREVARSHRGEVEVLEELRAVLAAKTSEKQRRMWKEQLFPRRTMGDNGANNGVGRTMGDNGGNNGGRGTIGNNGVGRTMSKDAENNGGRGTMGDNGGNNAVGRTMGNNVEHNGGRGTMGDNGGNNGGRGTMGNNGVENNGGRGTMGDNGGNNGGRGTMGDNGGRTISKDAENNGGRGTMGNNGGRTMSNDAENNGGRGTMGNNGGRTMSNDAEKNGGRGTMGDNGVIKTMTNNGTSTMSNNAENNGRKGTMSNNGDDDLILSDENKLDENGNNAKNNAKNNAVTNIPDRHKSNNAHPVLPGNFEDLSETLLEVPRRISAPGRPPTRKSLKLLRNIHGNPVDENSLNRGNDYSKSFNRDDDILSKSVNHDKDVSLKSVNHDEDIPSKSVNHDTDVSLKSVNHDEDISSKSVNHGEHNISKLSNHGESEQSDWTKGLGIGFSASMAQQVARIAQNRGTNVKVLCSENDADC